MSSSALRKMSLTELLGLMQQLGISTDDVEDRVSAALTKIMASAIRIKD